MEEKSLITPKKEHIWTILGELKEMVKLEEENGGPLCWSSYVLEEAFLIIKYFYNLHYDNSLKENYDKERLPDTRNNVSQPNDKESLD